MPIGTATSTPTIRLLAPIVITRRRIRRATMVRTTPLTHCIIPLHTITRIITALRTTTTMGPMVITTIIRIPDHTKPALRMAVTIRMVGMALHMADMAVHMAGTAVHMVGMVHITEESYRSDPPDHSQSLYIGSVNTLTRRVLWIVSSDSDHLLAVSMLRCSCHNGGPPQK